MFERVYLRYLNKLFATLFVSSSLKLKTLKFQFLLIIAFQHHKNFIANYHLQQKTRAAATKLLVGKFISIKFEWKMNEKLAQKTQIVCKKRLPRALCACLCEWKLKNLCLRNCFHSNEAFHNKKLENSFHLPPSKNTFSFQKFPAIFHSPIAKRLRWSIFWLNREARVLAMKRNQMKNINKHLYSVITDWLVVAGADCLFNSNKPSMIRTHEKKLGSQNTQNPISIINSSVLCCLFYVASLLREFSGRNAIYELIDEKKFIIYRQKNEEAKKNATAIKTQPESYWVTNQ